MAFTPRSADTRQLIIEATAALFNKKGYAGTSLSDMEKATSLTKGSIYGNFRDKEEVALAVFDYNLKKLIDKKRSLVGEAVTNKEKLMASIRVHGLFPKKNGGCPIQNTGVEADDTHEPLRRKAAKALLNWKDELVSLLENGKKEHEFRSSANAEVVAWKLIALIEGGILLSGILKERETLDLALISAKELLDGISVS